jgi:hypothetical protein
LAETAADINRESKVGQAGLDEMENSRKRNRLMQ